MDNNVNQQMYYHQVPQYEDPNTRPLDIKDWIIVLIVQMIPCIGFIMTLVWAFGSGNVNRKRYCQANLIIMIIGFVLNIIGVILMFTVFAGVIAGILESVEENIQYGMVIFRSFLM